MHLNDTSNVVSNDMSYDVSYAMSNAASWHRQIAYACLFATAGSTVNGHTPPVPPKPPLVPADVSGSAKLSPEEVSGIREGSQPPAQKAGKEPEIVLGSEALPDFNEAEERRRQAALRMGLPFISLLPLVPGGGMESPPEGPEAPPPVEPELAPAGPPEEPAQVTPQPQAGPSKAKGKRKRASGTPATPVSTPDSKGKGVLTRSQRKVQEEKEKRDREAAAAIRQHAAGLAAQSGRPIGEVIRELEQAAAHELETINPIPAETESEEEDLFSLAHKKARK
jgi:hypothetical protein